MMLADADEVDSDLVGQDALRHNVAQHLGLRQELAVLVDGHVAESV
ncbi:hypothetical protein [Mesorhizobium marinum]